MAATETAQEIDPITGVTSRLFVIVAGLAAVTMAAVLTVLGVDDLVLPVTSLAFISLGAGFGYLAWAADPARRVTRARFDIAFSLVLLACILDSLAQLGHDSDVRNDWGPITVALVLAVAASYRLPAEIAVRAAIALVVVVGIALINGPGLGEPGMIVWITTFSIPVVAVGGGAVIFCSSHLAGLRQERSRLAAERETRELRERRSAIEEFLGNDIETLRREVLPFLREVKAHDALTDADRRRADDLSRRVRASRSATRDDPPDRGLALG